MTETLLPPITASIEIAAGLRHVWSVVTTPALVEEWLGCMQFHYAVGATFFMQPDPQRRARGVQTGATHCTIKLIEPPHRLVFSWFIPGTPETLVEIRLEAIGDATTRVDLVHSGWEQFPPEAVRPFHTQLSGGWSGGVLPGLKRVAESPTRATS